MFIGVDIGNSNVTLNMHNGTDWMHCWRYPTIQDEPTVFYEVKMREDLLEHNLHIESNELTPIVLSSVVPVLTPIFKQLLTNLFGVEVLVVNPTLYKQLPIKVLNPTQIGTDLVANALAAYEKFKRAVIIVDFGTALTFTTLDDEGTILGVSIAPGLQTAVTSLFAKTAQLPEVPLELPPSVLGKNTTQAIQTGVLTGYVGLVRYLLQQIRYELGSDYMAIATGGLSSVLSPLKEDFEYIDKRLTMEGIRLIGQYCSKS